MKNPKTSLSCNSSGETELEKYIPAHLSELAQRNFSPGTIEGRRKELAFFIRYCLERSITEPSQITVALMERYRKFITQYRSAMTGKRLAPSTQIHRLATVKFYLNYLSRKGRMLFNPAAEIEMPKMGRRLPRDVLSAAEAEKILMIPDITTPVGLRNRAMLEILYSTGIRRAEMRNLDHGDIDFQGGTIFVREGKGQVDRVVPVGERALFWTEKYINEARPALIKESTEAVFISFAGKRISRDMITIMVRNCRKESGVNKNGAAHMFRHTAATLMLEGGADVRYVQQLLGHKELSSTQRYTHVAIAKLKEVHRLTHPAKFRKKK
jgi:integrase/recombinase XerD